MLSHQLNQNVIDGEKTIIQNPNEAQRKEHEKFDFELHEVYAIGMYIYILKISSLFTLLFTISHKRNPEIFRRFDGIFFNSGNGTLIILFLLLFQMSLFQVERVTDVKKMPK